MIADRLYRVAAVVGWAIGLAAVLVVLLVVGASVPTRPLLALAASGAVLVLGLTSLEPAALPLLAMAALVVVRRVTLPSVDLSASDVVLFAAVWPALFFARRGYSRPMRTLLWLVVVYQASTLFAVVANPYTANVIDWFHNFLLAGGALVVGWAVGREGYARHGLTLLLLGAAVLAAGTIVQGLQQYAHGEFSAVYPTWPFSMHKNFVGTTLASVAVIAYIHPAWMGWSRRWALSLFWMCAAAIMFSQSRQAVVALGVTLVFVVLRRDPTRTRSKLMLVLLPPAAAVVALTVKTQIDSGNNFNSVFQRVNWLGDSLDVWHAGPIFGVGLRWWYTDRFPVRFQPPNAELEVLTTAGVVGLVGFLVLAVGALLTLSRLDAAFGTVAVAVLLNRLVQGQFDIFWVSVGTSLPFVVAGVCLGAQARQEEGPGPPAYVEQGVSREEAVR